MQMDEAKQIAHFLRVTVADVMKHAGVAVDLDGLPTRVMLAATIDEAGYLLAAKDSSPLPQSVIEKARAATSSMSDNRQSVIWWTRITPSPTLACRYRGSLPPRPGRRGHVCASR